MSDIPTLTDRFDENRYDLFHCTYLLIHGFLLLRCLAVVLHELSVALLMLMDSINASRYVRLLITPLHLIQLASTLRATSERRVRRGLAVTDHLL